jgi:Flp pilus assembly pilin Flp
MTWFSYRTRIPLVAGLLVYRLASFKREEGQTFVEYAMILGLVVVTTLGALTFLHDKIAGFYTQIGNDFSAVLP